MILFLSAILKLLSFSFVREVWHIAAGCYALSIMLDVREMRRIGRAHDWLTRTVIGNVFLVNISALLLCLFLNDACDYFLVRCKMGLPMFAAPIVALLRLAGLPITHEAGMLHMPSMAGSLDFPVTADNLGLKFIVLLLGISLSYLSFLKTTKEDLIRAVLILTGIVAVTTILRMAFSISLFVFLCDFVGYKTESLPILPF